MSDVVVHNTTATRGQGAEYRSVVDSFVERCGQYQLATQCHKDLGVGCGFSEQTESVSNKGTAVYIVGRNKYLGVHKDRAELKTPMLVFYQKTQVFQDRQNHPADAATSGPLKLPIWPIIRIKEKSVFLFLEYLFFRKYP